MVAVRKLHEVLNKDSEQAICPKCKSLNYIDSTCSLILCDHCTNVFDSAKVEKEDLQLKLPFENDNVVRIDFQTRKKINIHFNLTLKIIGLVFAMFTIFSFTGTNLISKFFFSPSSKQIFVSSIVGKNSTDTLLLNAVLSNQSTETIRKQDFLLTTYDETGKVLASEAFHSDKKIKKLVNEKIDLVGKIPSNSSFYSLQLISAR